MKPNIKKLAATVATPALAGPTADSFIRKGERAKRFARQPHILAVCLGLLLLGPTASLKGGVMEGFANNIIQYVTIQAIEYGANSGLNQLNKVDGGYGTGTLMGILGGNTTDGKLDEISSQITVAQNMIASLQGDLDSFETAVAADQYYSALQAASTTYSDDIETVNADAGQLLSLLQTYTNVIAHCFTNNGTGMVIKSSLSDDDRRYFTNFVHSSAFRTLPDQVLADLDGMTYQTGGENDIYTTASTKLQLLAPFQHQTYGHMYNLFNYITATRTLALYLKKEYQSYQWSQQTNTSLATWMTNYFLEDFNGHSGLNTEVDKINGDVANNPILLTMATQLTNSVATNGAQRLAYLNGLISTNYPFPGGPEPAYKVICNFNQSTYVIPQQPGPFPYYTVENVERPYPALCYTMSTADGRYQLVPDVTGSMPDTLLGLLTLGTAGNVQANPLNYLTSTSFGGLTNLPSTVDGILLAKTQSINSGNDQSLYLLDAQGYAGVSNPNGQYLQNSSGNNFRLSDVDSGVAHTFSNGNHVALKNATWLTVYYDTDISTLMSSDSPGHAGTYYPTTSGALGSLVSLSAGEVLDLSDLKDSVNTTIRVYGDATILGGGPSMTISNLMIATYGGRLTISNLFLSSATNIINNASGDLTLVVLGTNCFQSTLLAHYDQYGYSALSCAVLGSANGYGSYGGDITFAGPGALAVTTTSTNMPAVWTAGRIIMSGASNLTFSTRSVTSVYAGAGGQAPATPIFIINSKVTSRVGVQSDNEFFGSPITLGDSVLDMSYGILNPNIVSHCTWLGAVRGSANIKVKTDSALYSGTGANIYLRLIGSTGATKFYNVADLPGSGSHWQDGDTDSFTMSYSITNNGTGDFQGLGILKQIQLYEDESGSSPHWTCDWVKIAPNVVGDMASTYQFNVNHSFNSASDVQTVPVYEEIADFTYTVNPDNTVSITGYSGPAGAVTVPSTIHGLAVTSIGTTAFENNSGVTSVMIPNSITNIGATAFYHCYSLSHLYFQGNAPSRDLSPNGSGYNNFAGDTNLVVCYLPETSGWTTTFGGLPTALWVPYTWSTNSDNASVTISGYTGFGGALHLPATLNGYPVTGIGWGAFNLGDSLTSLRIPASITNIAGSGFGYAYSLTAVYFEGHPPTPGVFNYNELATIYYLPTPGTTIWGSTFDGLPTAVWEPFTCTTNPGNASVTIASYYGPGGTVVIPETFNGLPVTGIATNAFASNPFASASKIVSVLIPGTVTNLAAGTFQMCPNLSGIFFQGNAPTVGANVFGSDATAYYLSASTGWSTTFGGLSAAPWLAVNGGTDGGDYSNLQQVQIIGNNPLAPNGQIALFAQWLGATQYVANINAARTTVNLPAQPIALTAMFNTAPIISIQPTNQMVNSGGGATFSVSAYGPPPLGYQWYFGNGAIGGATGTNYTVAGAQPYNSGDYSVVVTNSFGSVTSSVASLTVFLPPVITGQPVKQVVAAGGTVNLGVTTLNGGPQTYQWFKDGGMALGATNSTLNLANAGVTNSGVYYVVVQNAHGLTISQPATVTVGSPQLLTWGYNGNGQLGNATTNDQHLPQTIASNVVTASAGSVHSLFVKSDGTLWGMGANSNGELGDGTMTSRQVPVQIADNVVSVAGGGYHSLYLTGDGTLWGMGNNQFGQLGQPAYPQFNSPVTVANNVVAMAAGGYFSLALKNDGTLWAAGNNANGQLGDGSTNNPPMPESVASNVVAVAAGAMHSLYLKSDGTLWAMGQNNWGQLGDGTTINRSNPVHIASNVAAMACGQWHSLFLKTDRTLWVMGCNQAGQLGDDVNLYAVYSPECVASNVTAITAGLEHSLYLKPDGTLRAMGGNQYGCLGNGATNQQNSAIAIPGMFLASVVSEHSAFHNLAVGVPQAPMITTEPASQTIITGSNVTFTVAASGFAPLSYQWFFNGNTLPTATASNYIITGAALADAGNYAVVVNSHGGSVTSSVAALTVVVPPTITAAPTNQVVAAGGTIHLNMTASGASPLVYQWFKNGALVPGATNASLTVPNAGAANSGVYYVAVKNPHGLILSTPVTVTAGAPQLLAWGNNGSGELGNGTWNNLLLPASVATNVVMAAAGQNHSLFISGDGTLWAMGQNGYGQLGDGTTANRATAESVASNVVSVAAGDDHSLFVKQDGTLWTVGYNGDGELGDGTLVFQRNSPECVASNVVAAAGGQWHSMFLKSDGSLWTMGQNMYGQLGDGTLTSRSLPVVVASNVVSAAAGHLFSLYLQSDGTLWAMGQNNFGQLGNGTSTDQHLPISVASNVTALAAGANHTLFLKADGTLWGMGDNQNGQLGSGGVPLGLSPVCLASNVVATAAGAFHSLFQKSDGSLLAMGLNTSGQLGDGTAVSPRTSPVTVPAASLSAVITGCNASHTFAIGSMLPPVITQQTTQQSVELGGTVNLYASPAGAEFMSCQWFKNGGLILGATNSSFTIADATEANAGVYYAVFTNLYGSAISIPALVAVGNPQLLAWGNNGNGQLGDGSTGATPWPESVATNVVMAAAGEGHSLYLTANGTLWATGGNNYGQLGDGTTASRDTAEPIASNVVSVVAGDDHSLFVKQDGTLWAMGYNGDGELGDGTTVYQRNSPECVASNVVAAAGGQWHSLYLKGDGTLWTMGQNMYGQLGDGTLNSRSVPGSVASNVVAIAGGQLFSLYLKSDGTLWGMGQNNHGQLGDGTTSDRHLPVSVASNAVAVAAGGSHSLYLGRDGTLWAMGDNSNGQLGIGSAPQSLSPVPVAGNVATMTAGVQHSLFYRNDGTLWAMGNNQSGQLGNGTSANQQNPVAVPGMFLGAVVSGCNASHTFGLGLPLSPVITSQPTNQTVLAGSQVNLGVTAGGFSRIACQWFFNGTEINGATATNYHIPSALVSNAGNYSVVVSNSVGSVTSSVVTLTVNLIAPTVTWPTAAVITYGQTLASATLSGGSASVGGTFAFAAPSGMPGAGIDAHSIVFTPANTAIYSVISGSIPVTVNQAAPHVTTWPTATAITYGQTLASSTLNGGVASVDGSFAFTTPTSTPNAGTASQAVTFTPTDAANYASASGNASVTVNQAAPNVTTWPTATAITYGQTLASSTLSGAVASVAGSFDFTAPSTAPSAGTASQAVTFTPADTANYNTISGSVSVTVNAAATTSLLVSSANPSIIGSSVTFTATSASLAPCTATPLGEVQFFTNGAPAGAPVALAQGVASIDMASLGFGSNIIQAVYLGGMNFQASTNTLVQLVIANIDVVEPVAVGITNNGDGTITITFLGKPEVEYCVQGSADLTSSTNWLNLSTNTAGADGLWTYTESIQEQPARFYRAVQELLTAPDQMQVLTVFRGGTIFLNWGNTNMVPGRVYTATAVSSAEHTFAGWGGGVSGTNTTLTFVYHPGLVLHANFTPVPYVATNGTFNGLFRPPEDATHQNSGFITVSTTLGGEYTGKLQIGGGTYPLSGRLDDAGMAVKVITRRHQSPLTVRLSMGGSTLMFGSVSNASWVAEIIADRALYDAKTRPAPRAGQHTLVIAGTNGDSTLPEGNGFGTATVSKGGVVRFAVSLADGQKVSLAVPISQFGQAPFYARLYSGQGSILGWISFAEAPELRGSLAWTKPITLSSYHPSSFALTTGVHGARYDVPGKGTNVFGTTSSSLKLVLDGGGLPSGITNAFTLNARNQVAMPALTDKLTLKFNASSGLFRGSQVIPGTRKAAPFKGVIVQGQTNGAGYFLGTDQTGRVRLENQ